MVPGSIPGGETILDTVAEWSNARDLSPLLFGGAGSNPAGVIIVSTSRINQ